MSNHSCVLCFYPTYCPAVQRWRSRGAEGSYWATSCPACAVWQAPGIAPRHSAVITTPFITLQEQQPMSRMLERGTPDDRADHHIALGLQIWG